MALLNSIISRFTLKRMHQINLFRKHPSEVQQKILLGILAMARKTEWGKRYDFRSVTSAEQFRERLPVTTYEDIRNDIQRLRKGERDISWPGEIRWFAKSAGTTSDKSKFIPVSKESLEECHYRGGKDVLVLYNAINPDTRIFLGKGLTLGGSSRINNFSNDSYYGDLSAILLKNIPLWADLIRTPPQKIALIDEWEQKLEKITEVAIHKNVTNIAGVPSWNLVLIHYILKKTGRDHLLEVWPNLELFIHGGVSFVPYREQFKQVIPSGKMHYLEVYNASEGFFSIQDDLTRDDMLLMLDYGVFYEFIPLEELGNQKPVALHIGEVEMNRNYAMVISTNGGLWRHLIGDTVVFTSLYPHKIRITGRTKHFINTFGEELIIDNATWALKVACETTGAVINEYTAGPVYMEADKKGCHEWLIEFKKPPSDPELFTDTLDQELMSVNSDYEAKRYKNITLGRPVVRSMMPGVFYAWLADKKKLGGQNKVPRLSNDRKYLEEILRMHHKRK